MVKLAQLQMITSELGFDDQLQTLLLKGCTALPELSVSKVLSDLESARDSIPNLLRRTDNLLAALREDTDEGIQRRGQAKIASPSRKVSGLSEMAGVGAPPLLALPSKQKDSFIAPTSTTDIGSSELLEDGGQNLQWPLNGIFFFGMQSLLSGYIFMLQELSIAILKSMEVYSSLGSQAIPAEKTPPGQQAAIDAVRYAISASSASYDSMAKAAAYFSSLVDSQTSSMQSGELHEEKPSPKKAGKRR